MKGLQNLFFCFEFRPTTTMDFVRYMMTDRTTMHERKAEEDGRKGWLVNILIWGVGSEDNSIWMGWGSKPDRRCLGMARQPWTARDDGVRPRALAFKRWRLSSLHSFTSILAGPISRHERVFCWLARVLITDAICPFFLQFLIFWSAVLGSLAPGLPWPLLVALLVSIPSPYYRLSYTYIYIHFFNFKVARIFHNPPRSD